MSIQEADALFGVRDAARELGLSDAMVRRFCAAGKLPARLIGKTYVIRASDLQDFMALPRPRVGWPKGQKRR